MYGPWQAAAVVFSFSCQAHMAMQPLTDRKHHSDHVLPACCFIVCLLRSAAYEAAAWRILSHSQLMGAVACLCPLIQPAVAHWSESSHAAPGCASLPAGVAFCRQQVWGAGQLLLGAWIKLVQMIAPDMNGHGPSISMPVLYEPSMLFLYDRTPGKGGEGWW